MADLKIWQDKIKAKRQQTEFRDFVKEVCSWFTLVLYKNNDHVSKYPPLTDRVKNTVPYKEFEAQRDTLTSYGRDWAPNKSFFEQFNKLLNEVPFPHLLAYGTNENTEFGNEVLNSKNIYLSSVIIMDCENVLYSTNIKENSQDVLNSNMVWNNSSDVYFGNGIIESTSIFYSNYIKNSYNIWFSSNLTGCQNCLFCNDLENQSYCIRNQKYEKEEYLEKKKELLAQKDKFLDWYKDVDHIGKNHGSTNVSGMFVQESQNVQDGYMSYQLKSCKNAILRGGKGVNEDMADIISGGTVGNNDIYGVHGAGAGSDNLYCGCHLVGSNIYYSYYCSQSSYCLGCVGLVNQQFCIFNKQYEKEERFELANKIFEKMEKDGELGKFFPGWMSPFYFNDTAAYLIDHSFTKEEVTKEGYLRRDEEIKIDIPEGIDAISANELDQYQGFDKNGKRTIDPVILEKVIIDQEGNYYKIVKMEYNFLMKHELPLPKIHWLERIKLGFRFT